MDVYQYSSPLALTYSKHGADHYAFSSLHILVFAYILVATVTTIMHVRMYGRRSWAVLDKKRALELIPVAFFDGGIYHHISLCYYLSMSFPFKAHF
jgi:hypothetical protein